MEASMKTRSFFLVVLLLIALALVPATSQAQGLCESSLPADIHYNSLVDTLFPEGGDINPSYVTDTASPNLLGLSPSTLVSITFMGSVTSYTHNRLGYFLFDSSNTIVDSGAVVFADASTTAAGTTVTVGPFPANSNLGFYIDVNGDSPPNHVFYSLQNLNSDDTRHFAAAFIPSTSNIAFGVEDLLNGGDTDYNDMVFALTVCGSVNYCNIPDNFCDSSCNDDPDCECSPGQSEQRPCGTDEGACVAGSQSRSCGQDHRWEAWGECLGSTAPSPELCDGIDNDCDGQSDEELTDTGAACSTPEGVLGACASEGVIVCSNGQLSCSATAGSPSNETCDGIDNDCDGQVDEDGVCIIEQCEGTVGGQSCSAGTGACQATGSTVCTAQGAICDAIPGQPGAELCDGIDNDCDGEVDEGDVCESNHCNPCMIGECCVVGKGVCQASGFLTCIDGEVVCDATPQDNAAPEVCDHLDNDCDGEVDEGLNCSPAGSSEGDVQTTPALSTASPDFIQGQGCSLNKSTFPQGNLAFILGLGALIPYLAFRKEK